MRKPKCGTCGSEVGPDGYGQYCIGCGAVWNPLPFKPYSKEERWQAEDETRARCEGRIMPHKCHHCGGENLRPSLAPREQGFLWCADCEEPTKIRYVGRRNKT